MPSIRYMLLVLGDANRVVAGRFRRFRPFWVVFRCGPLFGAEEDDGSYEGR